MQTRSALQRSGEFDFSRMPALPFNALTPRQRELLNMCFEDGAQSVVDDFRTIQGFFPDVEIEIVGEPRASRVPAKKPQPMAARSTTPRSTVRSTRRVPGRRKLASAKTKTKTRKGLRWVTRDAVDAYLAQHPKMPRAEARAIVKAQQAAAQGIQAPASGSELRPGQKRWATKLKNEIERAQRENGETIDKAEAGKRLMARQGFGGGRRKKAAATKRRTATKRPVRPARRATRPVRRTAKRTSPRRAA